MLVTKLPMIPIFDNAIIIILTISPHPKRALWPSTSGTLTVDVEDVFGASFHVEVIDVLGDDDHGAPLLPQPGLALGHCQVCRVGLLGQNQVPPVVVELPDTGGVTGEGLRCGNVLDTQW